MAKLHWTAKGWTNLTKKIGSILTAQLGYQRDQAFSTFDVLFGGLLPKFVGLKVLPVPGLRIFPKFVGLRVLPHPGVEDPPQIRWVEGPPPSWV